MKKNKLKKYQAKRDFSKTPEPSGRKTIRGKGRIFVVQRHAASHLHYDFRLELNGVLLSWAVPKGPCLDPRVKRLAIHVEDHPLSYANFEGVIPKGHYGAGTVMLWDKGKWLEQDAEKAYKKGHMTFILQGKKLKGKWTLIRINRNNKTWLLIKMDDVYASPLRKSDVLHHESPAAIKQPKLKKARFPTKISPQLATLTDVPPEGKQWLYEIKLDGYRIIAFKKNNQTQLITRNGKDWTSKFPAIARAITRLPITNVILDGELVANNKQGLPDFQLLQNSIKSGSNNDFIYHVFDILYYDQFNVMKLPLIERKKILKDLSRYFLSNELQFNDHLGGSGKRIYAHSCKLGLEGIIAKQANASYEQRRSKTWLKVKCSKEQEFVIAGYTLPGGSRRYFGSLLLGTFNNKKQLLYHGHVGTGFTQASLRDIYKKLTALSTAKCPFAKLPAGSKKVKWVKPKLVAQVEFTEWTTDDSLRHPSFKGLRQDKPASKIKKEKPVATARRKNK